MSDQLTGLTASMALGLRLYSSPLLVTLFNKFNLLAVFRFLLINMPFSFYQEIRYLDAI